MNPREELHEKIFYYLVIILAAALPLSVYATSVIQFALLLNWLFEGNFRTKISRITQNKAFLIYTVFFLVHIIGMLWTSDMEYGLRDLKIKLPLLAIPFIIVSSGNFNLQQIRIILSFFIAGTLTATFASMLAFLGFFGFEIDSIRDASLFLSHIRFSLMIVLSVLFSFYLLFAREKDLHASLKWFYIFNLAWLPVFLILFQTLTGIIILIIISVFIALKLIQFLPDPVLRFMVMTVIVFIPLFSILYLGNAINRFYSIENVDLDNLDTHTINNNPYIHKVENDEFENGNYVWIYISPEELQREWNEVSEIDYMGKAADGDPIRYTLIRYMASKGLRKDSVGVHRLNETDIKAIEDGTANYIYLEKYALYPRIYEMIWEFDRYRLGYDPNDKSIIQRYYFMKAGINILQKHVWVGVGTGDVRSAFKNYYNEIDSPLREKRRRNAHNQYLTFALALGVPGFILVMGSILVPVFLRRRWNSYMLVVFLLTMALSMLAEDTLSNTPGVVMFGFFYSLFVFGPDWEWGSLVKKWPKKQDEKV